MSGVTHMRDRLAGLAILGLALASSACNGSGMTAPWRRPGDAPYVVERPRFDAAGRKNFYVSGYAGASYGPLIPRRASALPDVSLGQPRTVVEEGDWPIVPE